jgi:hypothetical protein
MDRVDQRVRIDTQMGARRVHPHKKMTIVEDEDDQVVKLALDHIFLALIVLLVGFMIATLTLVVELLT